jgi:hypothetical protein
MKKIVLMCAAVLTTGILFAQKSTTDSLKVISNTLPKDKKTKKASKAKEEKVIVPPAPKVKKDWTKLDLSKRPTDHLMIQYGYDGWASKPDIARLGEGFSRHFNIYVMFDKPFKSDERFSVAYGGGIGSSSIFFNTTLVDITGKTSGASSVTFQDASTTNHYKKFKLATTYFEIPVEIRFMTNPENNGKSWKFAAGIKAGYLLDAHTKGKTGVDKNGNTLTNEDGLIEKESSTKYFNNTKLAGTVRIGYGSVSLYGAYQVTSLITGGVGADIRPYSIGVTFSGL